MGMYVDTQRTVKGLIDMRDELRSDIEDYDEFVIVSDAVDIIEGMDEEFEELEAELYEVIGNLEEEIGNLETELYKLDREFEGIDAVIDKVVDLYATTTEDLKEILRRKGLKVTGTKPQLIDRIISDDRIRGVI